MDERDAVSTVEASDRLHSAIPGAHTKNLFLKDAGNQFWLVTGPHNARVDLKALPTVIGSKKLSFVKAEDMARLLAVTPGSVTPLAAMNDEELTDAASKHKELEVALKLWGDAYGNNPFDLVKYNLSMVFESMKRRIS